MSEPFAEFKVSIANDGITWDTELEFKDLLFWLRIAEADLIDQFFENTRVTNQGV